MGFWDFITGSTPAGIISETGQKVVTGVFEGVTTIIKEFHLSDADKVRFDLMLKQLELDTTKTHMADTQSARAMQMATPSPWPGILSTIVTLGFFAALLGIVKQGLPDVDDNGGQAILILLGTLTAGFTMVLNFWLGSSQGSQVKDQMIWHSQPVTQVSQLPQIPQTPQTPQTPLTPPHGLNL